MGGGGSLLNFYRFLLKEFINKKKCKVKIDSSVSSGGQEKLAYFVYFPWPPLEIGLSLSSFWFLFNLLTPNVNYSGRTAPLTSKVPFYIFIQQI